METILEKIFSEFPARGSKIDIGQMKSDLETTYKIKFVKGRFIDVMKRCGLINTYNSGCYPEFFMTNGPTVKTMNKEDILKYIDSFFSSLVRSCVEFNKSCELNVIKKYVEINNGIILSDEQVSRYLNIRYPDKEFIDSLICERKNITCEMIRKISNILDLDEENVVPFLTENGYKFKISESDLKNVSLTKERVEEILDYDIKNLVTNKINYAKVIELCNDRKESINWNNKEELEKVINKYSLKEKEIVGKLGGKFVGFYDQVLLEKFCSDNKIEMIPLMMIIGNMKE